ncbi:hypothetical protein NQZ68_014151, partial [Dissostichus eleginoides]
MDWFQRCPSYFQGAWMRRSLRGQTTLPEVGNGGWKASLVSPGEDRVIALGGKNKSEGRGPSGGGQGPQAFGPRAKAE